MFREANNLRCDNHVQNSSELNLERFNTLTSAPLQPVTIDTIPGLNLDNYLDIRWFKYNVASILAIIVVYPAFILAGTGGNPIQDLSIYDNGIWLFVAAQIIVWFQVLLGLSTEEFLARKRYENQIDYYSP